MRLVRVAHAVAAGLFLTACDSERTSTAPTSTPLVADLQAARGPRGDFEAIDLGTLGGTYSHSVAINNAGQVAGNSWINATGTWHAFLWDKGVLTDLGTLGDESLAIAMNNRGQVIGTNHYPGGTWRGFLWDRGVMTDLGALGGGRSYASAINDAGQIIGYGFTANGEAYGFIWERGVMTDLGSLTLPLAINNAEQIVGSSGDAAHAFLWQSGVTTELATLGGGTTQASAINNRGQIAGNGNTATGEWHAFLWENGVTTDLGSLGGTFSSVEPGDIIPGGINDRGQIAGVSQTATGEYHAFLWDRGVMADLGTLLGMHSSVGWVINNAGEMIGTHEFITQDCAVDHVFYWAKGVMIDLPTLNGAGSECPTNWPAGINNAGQVAGSSDGHAVLWQLKPSAVAGR